MNEIERFLDRACCGVGGSPELRGHLRKELQEHLDEEIERNVAAGMAQEEAVQKAIEEFGDPVMIRDGLQSVHGRRLMTLLIEKSMIWRERTMKTGWKWSFVALVALVLTIAVEVFFAAAMLTYFVPSLKALHENLGTSPFALVETVFRLAGLWYEFLWVPCLLLVLVGWGLFEWRCRSESKSTVRLAGLSLASFVMFLVMAMICAPVTIDLAILPRQIYDLQVNLSPQQAERIILPKIVEGEAAFKELKAAIDREDWPVAGVSAEHLNDTYQSLEDVGNATIVLAGENQRDNLDDIHYLIQEIEESSDKIHHRFQTYERSKSKAKDNSFLKPKVPTLFKQLEASYAELRTKSDLFAAPGTPKTSD